MFDSVILHSDPVWKVARYTSAIPLFFSECNNYVDGGVICNNPTEDALTAIQSFFCAGRARSYHLI